MALSRISPPRGIEQRRIRTGEELLGVKDSTNIIFDSPEDFDIDLEGGFYFEFFRNGQLQLLGKQYVILSLNGVGFGIRTIRPPKPNDSLVINYVTSN